ncbi:MAG: hypothetical protein J6Y62_01790 [Clostridia bacterium]|nr:hypothetical protein [Clostridia bacterium]
MKDARPEDMDTLRFKKAVRDFFRYKGEGYLLMPGGRMIWDFNLKEDGMKMAYCRNNGLAVVMDMGTVPPPSSPDELEKVLSDAAAEAEGKARKTFGKLRGLGFSSKPSGNYKLDLFRRELPLKGETADGRRLCFRVSMYQVMDTQMVEAEVFDAGRRMILGGGVPSMAPVPVGSDFRADMVKYVSLVLPLLGLDIGKALAGMTRRMRMEMVEAG